MSDDIVLATGAGGDLVEISEAQPQAVSRAERLILYGLGTAIGGLMLVSLGFLGLVTYISLSSPIPTPPKLVCPPICRIEAR